jgi:hypothetical protein
MRIFIFALEFIKEKLSLCKNSSCFRGKLFSSQNINISEEYFVGNHTSVFQVVVFQLRDEIQGTNTNILCNVAADILHDVSSSTS